jgi:hypothetical protein
MNRPARTAPHGLPRAASALALWALWAAPRPAGAETLVQVLAGRAYLDRGTADGLREGQSLSLSRNGRPIGTCALDSVAEHHASCEAPFARKGDFYPLRPAASPPALVAKPVAPLSEPELASRRAALEGAAVPLVEAKVSAAPPALRGAVVGVDLAHASYATLDGGGGSYHQERVDVELRGVTIGQGFRAFVSLSALRWTQPANARFRPDAPTQLYVREGELSSRTPGRSWTFSAGRVQPLAAPGLYALDGVQGGWRNSQGTAEVGVYGGLLPDAVTLAPTLRATGGAYWSLASAGGERDSAHLVRHEGRIAFITGGNLAQRFEAEGLVQASLAPAFDASADVKLAAGGPGPLLQAARLDLGLRAAPTLRLSGGYRFTGSRDEALLSVDPIAYGGRSHHADLGGAWDLTSGLTLSLAGGLAADLDSALTRGYVGPELSLPRAFGAVGGLSFSYLEQLGWSAGRMAAAQASLLLWRRVQLVGRLSYFMELPQGAAAYNQEGGLFAYASAPLTSWLALRLSALARLPLDWAAGGAIVPALSASAALAGSL